MTGTPRKGRFVTFAPGDGLLDAHEPSSVTGLRFNVEARSGGAAQLDFTDLRPRSLAIDAARAIRRLIQVGGPLGARSTIKAYSNTLRIYFAFLASKFPDLTMCRQTEAAHIDRFEEWLEAEGKSRVYAFTILSKIVVVFREIDAKTLTGFRQACVSDCATRAHKPLSGHAPGMPIAPMSPGSCEMPRARMSPRSCGGSTAACRRG